MERPDGVLAALAINSMALGLAGEHGGVAMRWKRPSVAEFFIEHEDGIVRTAAIKKTAAVIEIFLHATVV